MQQKLPSWRPNLGATAQWFLSAVVGGAVVALVQQFFAVQLEQNKTLLELQKQAYTDFFAGQAAARRARNVLSEKNRYDRETQKQEYEAERKRLKTEDKEYKDLMEEVQKRLFKSRFFIGVYGTKPTVEAISRYASRWLGPYPPCDLAPIRDDIQIYQRMRDEMFGGGVIQKIIYGDQQIDDNDAALVMLSCQLSPNTEVPAKTEVLPKTEVPALDNSAARQPR